ncbi:SRPBCC family protein [Hyphomicrobium sulfonivorans]|uniref:SRPBCC family protein n=1 Tax=Hyphomicrobium sulfonivorans TaxID=121290 RepID=UPI001FE5BBBD|nr:SRPBCC family protein [Hyphomicrobium sulfonivorans]
MKLQIAAALLSIAMLPFAGGAQAHHLSSKEDVEVKVDKNKSAEELKALWDQFGGWCAIADWHPAVKTCEEIKEGDDVFRKLTLQDGGVIKEKLIEKGDSTYTYAITESPLPVKNYQAQFSIVPDNDDADEVKILWTAKYDAADGKKDGDATDTIDGIFKDGLKSIKEKLGKKAD